jgi:hypothetical protein
MKRFVPSVRSLVRHWQLTVVFTLVAVVAVTWVTAKSRAQCEPGMNVVQVLYDGTTEVGRVYRDVAGPVYTEHWVLYPNFTFDQGRPPGRSFEVVAEPGPG